MNDIKSFIKEFSQTEISEINRYLTSITPFGVLEELYALSENPIEKSKIFCDMNRILNACRNYVKDDKTRAKLQIILEGSEDIATKLRKLVFKYNQYTYGRRTYENQISDIITNKKINTKINNLIDSFLILSEKLSFFDIDKIAGVESGKKEGSDIVDSILEDKTED